MKRTARKLAVCTAGVLLIAALSGCGAQHKDADGSKTGSQDTEALNTSGQEPGELNTEKQEPQDNGGEETADQSAFSDYTPPEYEPSDVNKECSFGTENENYLLTLQIDTFKEDMFNLGDLKREGDWLRLTRGDICFEISYRTPENAEEYEESFLKYQMVQYFQQNNCEISAELLDFVHEMTKPVETDKYRIPTMMIDGQECMVTCYEYPVRLSMLGWEDVTDLEILYRVEMPNGDALFFRGMRISKYTLDYYMSQALSVWAIDSVAGETLNDITVDRFKEYMNLEEYNPWDTVKAEHEMFAPSFERLEDGLCEIMETIVITAGR